MRWLYQLHVDSRLATNLPLFCECKTLSLISEIICFLTISSTSMQVSSKASCDSCVVEVRDFRIGSERDYLNFSKHKHHLLDFVMVHVRRLFCRFAHSDDCCSVCKFLEANSAQASSGMNVLLLDPFESNIPGEITHSLLQEGIIICNQSSDCLLAI